MTQQEDRGAVVEIGGSFSLVEPRQWGASLSPLAHEECRDWLIGLFQFKLFIFIVFFFFRATETLG